jgi:hypothetical protein
MSDKDLALPEVHPDYNMFGGKNPHGLYVPMSEDEQEVIHRLIEDENIELVIHGWATLDKPQILVGDLRVSVYFNLTFNGGMAPLHFLDLELRTKTGISIFKQRMVVEQGGKPIMVGGGIYLEFAWDIAIDHMNPDFVKAIKPGALGLTSRRLDKDTKERTAKGNMKLTEKEQNFLKAVEDGAGAIRKEDAEKVAEISKVNS